MEPEAAPQRFSKTTLALLVLVLCLGTFARIYPSAGFKSIGFDEQMYATYTDAAVKYGLTDYARVVDDYIAAQTKQHDAVVPAMRIGLIWPAAIISRMTGVNGMRAVRIFAAATAVLLLLATAAIGYRLGTPKQTLIVTALVAAAPLQIFLAQRSLGDEPFAFWAVLTAWFFFESLRDPKSRTWVIAFAISLFMLVLTKENAAFVCAALFATWLCLVLARVTPPNFVLLGAAAITGSAAVVILASYLGGLPQWFAFYRLYAAKSAAIPYVLRFQDGPWYRYLVDFTLMSPVIVALVFARLAKIDKQSRADLFWALFLGFSFIAMSIVRFGMSLRFAAYWDEPLRWLAASEIVFLANRFAPRFRNGVMIVAVVVLIAVDLAQYDRFFIKAGIYDPVSSHLLRASWMVK
jgi:hypothetical protein